MSAITAGGGGDGAWIVAAEKIERASAGDDTDELIETVLDALSDELGRLGEDVWGLAGVEKAVMAALAKAESALTRRDALAAAVQVAWYAENAVAAGVRGQYELIVTAVVDALAARVRQWRTEAFLGPEALHALAMVAERSALARSELESVVLRLGRGDQRYLLIRAAKVIGRLECLGFSTGTLIKLTEWEGIEDLAVQAEVHAQSGTVALCEALRAADLPALRRGLRQSAVALQRAVASEEQRRDAVLLLRFVEVLLDVVEDAEGRDAEAGRTAWAEQVGRSTSLLRLALLDRDVRPWRDFASPLEQALEYRLLRVSDGLACVAESVSVADEWTNLDEALVDLAATCVLMSGREAAGGSGIAEMLSAVEHVAVVPRVGPLIAGSIGRKRFRGVMEHYCAAHGDDHTSQVLRRLYEAAVAQSGIGNGAAGGDGTSDSEKAVSPDDVRRLVALSPQALATVIAAAPSVRGALAAEGYDVELEAADAAGLFPKYVPGLYADDPAVDAAVRPLLDAAWTQIGHRLRLEQWARVRDTLVFLVTEIRDLRDDQPPFALRTEDGGLGQQASEADLQDYLYRRLRHRFARVADWERSRIAGGRSDLGLRFVDCEIPIEVKAEYRNVSREHLRTSYLAQVDDYAAVRDDVAVLMILDLRAQNAAVPSAAGASAIGAAAGCRAGGLTNARASGPSGALLADDDQTAAIATGGERSSLYSLRESFWVEGLHPDPQVTGARAKAVIVGLVPGNRPRPSATTTYSRRPRMARLAGA